MPAPPQVPSLTNAACRVVIDNAALRSRIATRRATSLQRPWIGIWIAVRHAMPSPQMPTVGAGSSRFSRRFPRPPVHHTRASYRISPFPVVLSHMVMLVQVVFVATWRAASRLEGRVSGAFVATWRAASRFRNCGALPKRRVAIKTVGLRVWLARIMGDGRGLRGFREDSPAHLFTPHARRIRAYPTPSCKIPVPAGCQHGDQNQETP